MKPESVQIGVDTGGTFTDFFIVQNGCISIRKILSTPANPAEAILEGIRSEIHSPEACFIIHGTTVATNALLERKGGPIGLVTTSGFEDILFIARQTRTRLYSLQGEERSFILPRSLCFGIDERTTADGCMERSPSDEDLEALARLLRKNKLVSVAVSLINAYADNRNEEKIGRFLEKNGFTVSISSRLLPEYREYERTALATVNAYLVPVITRYLDQLQTKLGRTDLRIMQSNEGFISPDKAKREPIRTSLSGPAGGVVAAFHVGRAAGADHLITFDMGGTSTDVSLIDGKIRQTHEGSVGNFPVRLPIIDIHSVGVGGGSLTFLDKGGALRVGPESAGANPGPACYGKGSRATVTDANCVLGRIVPRFFLGGAMPIFPDRSEEAIGRLARQIGKSIPETAEGIIAIANANMEKAIRVISIERGHDPRFFTLFSFGGAGGIHAADISRNLRIPRIIVPKNAGVLSAMGFLLSDSIRDYSQSLLAAERTISEDHLSGRFNELADLGLREMEDEGFSGTEVHLFRSLDLRYSGQSYEINIPHGSRMEWLEAFHQSHCRLYSYAHLDRDVEIVNIRLKAVGSGRKLKLQKHPPRKTDSKKACIERQPLFYGGSRMDVAVFDRALLFPGFHIKGPALAADYESTTFCPPGYRMVVDSYLNLIITHE